jgi:hypothetical protein
MSNPPQDPSDRTQGFGPNRHRMEIELMEKRFRERSERHGGGPVSTGEIDGKVSEEMQQFFDESTQTLQNVVPQLREGDSGEQMLETTGEIRKKIDEFFSGVNDPNAAAQAAAAEAARAPAPPAPPPAPAAPVRAAAAPAPSAPPAAQPRAAIQSGRFAVAPPAAARPAAPSASAASSAPAESGQMDLRTALEKLRRHGGAKIGGPASPAPARPPAAPATSWREPTVAADRPPVQPPAPPAPRPAAPARPPAAPSAKSPSATSSDRFLRKDPPSFLPSPDELPRREPSRDAQAERPARQVGSLPPLSTDDIPQAPPPELKGLRSRQTPDDVKPAPRPAAPGETPPVGTPRKDPTSGDKFDSIFDEVQDIVLGTLKVSVSETVAAARDTASEFAEVAVPTAEPTSEVSVSPRADRFARPEEDDADEAKEEAPKGPYDWGVKAAPKPRGAWLLDTSEDSPVDSPTQEPPPRTVTSEVLSASVEAAKDAVKSGIPPIMAAGGARGYLVRKANDEVKRFQPVLKALRDKKLLDEAEAGDAPKADAAPVSDEFVSAETFRDSRPSPEEVEQELSPMRLVEELRRLKRVTQALLDKGVITADDLKKAAGE